jgi:hypothetical protein
MRCRRRAGEPDYFDPIEVHLPIHRSAQIQARLAGDQLAWQTIEEHVRAHEQMAMQAQAEVQNALPQPAQPPVDPNQQMQAEAAQQGEQRAQDMHQQQVRKAAADADLAEKRAQQTDFTPKPPAKGK